jgi:hypothetical protein
MNGQEFEFTAEQNETIQLLSHRMKWVGGFQILSGIGAIIAAIALFAKSQEPFALLLAGVVLLVVGLYTSSASKSFSDIVTTTGADITHLIEAVQTLKSLYNIQFWLIMAYVIIVGLVILAAIFRAFSSS